MSQVIIVVGSYFALLVMLSVYARPYRAKLASIRDNLGASDLNQLERAMVCGLIQSAYSWRAAIMLTLIYISGLVRTSDTIERECDEFEARRPHLARNPHLDDLWQAYLVSVLAVNPIFGLFAVVSKLAFRLKMRTHYSAKYAKQASEFVGLSVAV